MLAKKKKPGILISRKGLFIWIGLVVFIMCWMFVLGIIVGRGQAPVKLELGKLEQELVDLKAKMFAQEQAKLDADASGAGSDPPELGFYEALKSNKKAEPFKSLPQAPAKPPPKSPKKKSPAKPKPAVSPKPKPAKKKVAAVKPASKSAAKSKTAAGTSSQKGRFTIQVAASKDLQSAEKLVTKLRSKGYKAYQIRTQVKGKGVWYRVRVGAFKDKSAAGKVLTKLKASRFGGIVVRTR